jgi:hypothetical protein
VHLFGFIIKKFVTMQHGQMNVKKKMKIYVGGATDTMLTDNCPRIVHYFLTLRIGFVS